MPLYRFLCQNCGKEELLLLKMGQEPPSCPNCGGQLEKQISVPSLKLTSERSGHGEIGSCGSCSSGNCASCELWRYHV